jgi:type II secretory pathway component PulC
MSPFVGIRGGLVLWSVGPIALGATPDSPPPLPDSTLPIELVGVMAGAAGSSESACLVRCGYPQGTPDASILGPGEQACDVAEIAEVRQDSVVIKNLVTNRFELLMFRQAAAQPNVPAPADAEVPVAPPVAPPVVTKSSNLVTVTLRKDLVDYYLSHLPDVLDAALAAPHHQDDGFGHQVIAGFEITRIRQASVVEQLGLQNGDVILDVDGNKLDGLASVIRILGEVRSMSQVKMAVMRSGRRMTFVVNTK